MRDVEQVMRFYLISKRINCRTIKSLMDRPEWSPLLKLCVERLKTYKEFGIKRCKEIKKEIRLRLRHALRAHTHSIMRVR